MAIHWISRAVKDSTFPVIMFSIALALCLYLAVRSSFDITEISSERLYWEYAGRLIGAPWTDGYPEWIQHRIGQMPAGSSAASSVTRLPPYTGFSTEYPPGALLYFASLRSVVGDFNHFHVAHNFIMAATFLVALASSLATLRDSAVSHTGQVTAVVCSAILVYLVGGFIVARFDSLVAALAALGILLAQRGRPISGAALVGMGAAVKIWPIFLLPFIAPASASNSRWRIVSKITAVGVGVFLSAHVFWVPFGTALTDIGGYLRYAADRPPHSESMMVFVSALFSDMKGAETVFSYGSQNTVGADLLVGPTFMTVAFLALFTALALLTLALPFHESQPFEAARRQAALRLAAIALLLCTSKSFSGEYMVWLVPLALAVGGPVQSGVLVAAMAAAAGVKLSYVFYHDTLEMTAVGLLVSTIKWGALVMLVVLAGLLWIRPSNPAFRRRRFD